MATTTQTVETYDKGKLIDTQLVTITTTPEQDNDQTLRQQAVAALVNLRAIRDAPQVSVTSVAQAQTVCRQLQAGVQAEANALIRLARLLLGLLDGTD